MSAPPVARSCRVRIRFSELSDLVAPGVRRIQVPLPIPALRIVNAYLIEGAGGWSLVDSGLHTQEAERALLEGLADAGVAMRDVRRAFITLLHPDHMGMAGMLARASVEVLMHRPEIERAHRVWSPTHELIDETYVFFSRHGMPADVDEGGGRAERVRWTPGHTDHHAALVDERDRILFAGDHVLPRITSNVGLYPQSRDDPLGDFLDALRAMRDLPVLHVLPAHGDPFTDLAGRIDELLAHHDARLDAVISALGARERTAYEVAHDLFPKLRSPHEERFALAETLAHLRHLERMSKVAEVDGKVARWRAA
ncbi:MAG: MBL fold metallo-hydrolase [Chloroflexi bacterium]|nr:MAG: MBL fold metallo-hydrolase [Chloroflexota bacterium]